MYVALLVLRCEFLSLSIRQEEQRSNERETYIAVQSKFHGLGAGPPPDEQAFTDLEQHEKNIVQLREQLAAKQAELLQLRGPTGHSLYLQRKAKRQAVAHEAITRVRQIKS